MSADLTTSVEVAGTHLPTSAADLESGRATVLDGLTVRWGRSSRIDQPGPSTASLSIAIPAAQVGPITELCAPGARLVVTTDSASSAIQTTTVASNQSTYTHTSTTPRRIIPAAWQSEGTNPGAWDHLPTITRGSTYTLQQTVSWVPPGACVYLAPLYITGPWSSAATAGPALASRTSAGTLSASLEPTDEHLGEWMGYVAYANPYYSKWSNLTGTWTAYNQQWARYGRVETTAGSLVRSGASSATATPFAGRITDASLSWDESLNMPRLDLTAADSSAEHANLRIGSDPWPAETAAQRIARAISAAGIPIRTAIDQAPAARTLAPNDVDSQSLAQVIRDVAVSAGAILWPAAHRTLGEYYRLEDLDRRRALYTLRIASDGTAYIETASKGSTLLTASTVLRTVAVHRDTEDLASVVAVQWSEVATDQNGEPSSTQHTETATDPALLARIGYRHMSISTDLTTAVDAQALAARTIARSAPGGWTIPEAILDTRTDAASTQTALLLLDATTRIGHPLIISGSAPWVPGGSEIPVYLDGGSYTYRDSRWILSLQLTRAAVPADSIRWNQLAQSLTWANLAALTWANLAATQS